MMGLTKRPHLPVCLVAESFPGCLEAYGFLIGREAVLREDQASVQVLVSKTSPTKIGEQQSADSLRYSHPPPCVLRGLSIHSCFCGKRWIRAGVLQCIERGHLYSSIMETRRCIDVFFNQQPCIALTGLAH